MKHYAIKTDGGVCGVMVIIVGNGHVNPSSTVKLFAFYRALIHLGFSCFPFDYIPQVLGLLHIHVCGYRLSNLFNEYLQISYSFTIAKHRLSRPVQFSIIQFMNWIYWTSSWVTIFLLLLQHNNCLLWVKPTMPHVTKIKHYWIPLSTCNGLFWLCKKRLSIIYMK